MASADSLSSSYREQLLEHLLIGEIMKHLWLHGITRMEVLQPQVDDSGYDLVLEANGIVRHIQLKGSSTGAKTARVTVSTRLTEKPSGCVIWVRFDPKTLALRQFGWFGGAPGKPLPKIAELPIAKHAKGNALGKKLDRPMHRIVAKGRFKALGTIEDLIEHLFGRFKSRNSLRVASLGNRSSRQGRSSLR